MQWLPYCPQMARARRPQTERGGVLSPSSHRYDPELFYRTGFMAPLVLASLIFTPLLPAPRSYHVLWTFTCGFKAILFCEYISVYPDKVSVVSWFKQLLSCLILNYCISFDTTFIQITHTP